MEKVFVFGSNLAGRHGAGAARYAFENHGAKYGVGFGYMQYFDKSREAAWKLIHSFALPTKDENIKTLPLETVQQYVQAFLIFAKANPDMEFQVTKVGCGLAGFKDAQIAPLFKDAGPNCYFDEGWKDHLPGAKFWGKG